jgi:hypothetical protein
MTDSYNYGNINLGETAGLTRASIINGDAANGTDPSFALVVNFTGTASVFGDITLTQSAQFGTLVVINQPGTYFISASVSRDGSGPAPGAVSVAIGDILTPSISPVIIAIQSTDQSLSSNVSGMITINPSDINDLVTSPRNIRILSTSGSAYNPIGNTLIVTKV